MQLSLIINFFIFSILVKFYLLKYLSLFVQCERSKFLFSSDKTNSAIKYGLLSPYTNACSTKLSFNKSFSILTGEIFSPPGVIIISFFLSVIFK